MAEVEGQLQSPERTVPAQPAGRHRPSPTVRLIDAGELPQYEQAWLALCGCAASPNPFYEPWMLLPALELLERKETVRFLLVFGPPGKDGAEPLLGLFPLEIQSTCLKLPVKALAFWQHRWCYLTTPLIDSKHVFAVLDAFWRWFEENPLGCHILDTNYLLAEGRFQAFWADFAIGRASLMLSDFPRAFLEPAGTAESYIGGAIKKKHHDEFLRQERRLSEMGNLEYRQVESVPEVDAWVDDFLRMEANGWKGGDDGRAFAKRTEDTAYLRTITRNGFLEGRVMLLTLLLDGRAIAMKHNVLTGDGGFAFRIAYDETHSKFSPGVLLELENIRRVCASERLKWFDSCAAPRHVMANRLWSERRMIRRTLFSDSSRLGDFYISAFPFLRWIKKQIRPEQPPPYFQISTRQQKVGG